MRRIALFVAVLVLVSAVAPVLIMTGDDVAQAKKPTGTVAGHYTYYIDGDACRWRIVTIHATGTDPVKGAWTWIRGNCEGVINSFKGPVTCLRVNGDDAWIAGPTADGVDSVFISVHDGGSPGVAGDLAFTWGADPGETLADMEGLCQAETQPGSYPMDQMGPFPVVSGNLTVRDGG
jgi:hypothetical protein